MENGKWCTISDAPFMCLANMNKEGIPLHYHLPELVSTTTCWSADSSGPLSNGTWVRVILMENNGAW